MTIISRNPAQKAFLDRQDLSDFFLDLLYLSTYKKINLYETINDKSYIDVYDKSDVLGELSSDSTEYAEIDSLDSIKLQLSSDSNFFKNYFNFRISIGFKGLDLYYVWCHTYSENINFFSDSSREYFFLYLHVFPYQKTWRLDISNGNVSNNLDPKYHILAQDIILDYFQNKMFIKKKDYNG
ncbi:MAG: hypothetical protein ACOCV1_02385 [Bacillota bacterium]